MHLLTLLDLFTDCLRADVSYFLCCTRNKGNRRRLHAGNFTDGNDRFPTSVMYFHLWNFYAFTYLKPVKGTPFGRSLRLWVILTSTPRVVSLSFKSDRQQISPCNINTFFSVLVMRIRDDHRRRINNALTSSPHCFCSKCIETTNEN